MTTIIKRKKSYSVVYYYTDEKEEQKQQWETWHTHKDALKRKAEIENQLFDGTFITPKKQTVEEFLYDFVCLYGEKKWGVSTYDGNTGLIANYINPIIGQEQIQNINTMFADKFLKRLQTTPAVSTKHRKAASKYVTPTTIEKIMKLLRCAFGQAVKWELVSKNPFEYVDLPKPKYKKRDIGTADMIRLALDNCHDAKLYVSMNIAFACSLRIGEILGLTWDNVDISDDAVAKDNAWVYVDKELERASKRSIEALDQKDIYTIFPTWLSNTSTRLVLKKPKTDSSIHKVWLPKTLVYILREWKKSQDELREFLDEEYTDYNLVIAMPNGKPCEGRILHKDFHKLREELGLPNVVFHSLRHSTRLISSNSTTAI